MQRALSLLLIVLSIVFYTGMSSNWAQILVGLALMLAPVSPASVGNRDFEFRVWIMVRAFRDLSVAEAFRAKLCRAITVVIVEWASAYFQIVDISWTIIAGPEATNYMAALRD